MTTIPQRILPCPEAGPPANEQGEGDYTNKVSASVARLYDASALWLENPVADSNGDIAAGVTPTLSALIRGMAFWYQPAAQNPGPVFFTIGSAAPLECKTAEGVSLAGGEFVVGGIYKMVHDGTSLRILSTIVTSPTTLKAKPADQQVFLASGTWTKPTGFSAKAYVLIQIWGGAGGGARGTGTQGLATGGAGGAYRERWIPLSDLAATESVTIGQGGAPRTGSTGNGSNGGNSTFGNKITAYGGGGGNSGGVSNGGGLYAVGGGAWGDATDVFTGAGCPSNANGGRAIGGGGAGGAATTGGSQGGTSEFGGRGGNGGNSPQAGTQPGGGGGAGLNADGARGADGKCIVTVFDGI